jgi:hypothetical protein
MHLGESGNDPQRTEIKFLSPSRLTFFFYNQKIFCKNNYYMN